MVPPRVIIGYINPRHSMYGIFTYIGVVLGVNVGIYGIHWHTWVYQRYILISGPVLDDGA